MMYQRNVYPSVAHVEEVLVAWNFLFYPSHGWLTAYESRLDKGLVNVWRARIVPNQGGYSIQMQIVHSERS